MGLIYEIRSKLKRCKQKRKGFLSKRFVLVRGIAVSLSRNLPSFTDRNPLKWSPSKFFSQLSATIFQLIEVSLCRGMLSLRHRRNPNTSSARRWFFPIRVGIQRHVV